MSGASRRERSVLGELAVGLLLANAAFSSEARAQAVAQESSPQGTPAAQKESDKDQARSISELTSVRASAEDGDPQAQYQLAEWMSKGVVKHNPQEALSLYERSAQRNYPPAQFALGMLWKRGHAGGQSNEKALKLITASAKQGYPQAQECLGDVFFSGNLGLDVDMKASYSWYKLAAERGLPDSQYMVANFHLAGYEEVQPDRTVATAWLKKAAQQGHVVAMHNLGKVFFDSDPQQAFSWLQQSGKENFIASQLLAAELILSGKLPDKKPAEALALLKKAADSGSPAGEMSLAHALLRLEKETRAGEAAERLKAAAARDIPEAYLMLAELTYAGAPGIPANKREAFALGEKAAKLGSHAAQFQVGLCLHNGDGIPQDRKAAKDWFEKGAKEGDLNCQFMRALMQLDDTQNKKAAIVLQDLQRCAEANMTSAQRILGKLLTFGGSDLDTNPAEGARWLEKAAKAGCINSAYYLGAHLATVKKYDEALPWLKQAVDGKHPYAYGPFGLSLMYASADRANPKEGFALLLKAADLGFIEAQTEVAGIYWKGAPGIPRSPESSLKWGLRAAKQGDPHAARAVAETYAGQPGILQNLEECFKWHLITARYEAEGFKHGEGVIPSATIIKNHFKEPLDKVKTAAATKARLFVPVEEELPPPLEEKITFLEQDADSPEMNFSRFVLDGVPKDRNKLVSAYLEDAKFGSKFDKFTIGMIFLEGLLVERNAKLGTALLKEAAEGRLPRAQYEYGKLLLTENASDSSEGMNWLEQAAAQGCAEAQLDLGRRLVVAENSRAALRWFTEASSLGNVEAKIELAKLLWSMGSTTAPDHWKQIAALLEEASEKSHGEAQYRLALMIFGEKYPSKKASDGVRLLEESVVRGDPNAQGYLGRILMTGEHEVTKDYNKAFETLSSATKSGLPTPHLHLGELFLRADNPKRDPIIAFEHFQAAAARGIVQAHFRLGQMRLEGTGAPKNIEEALRHFDTIARAGSVDAQYHLARLRAGDAGQEFVDRKLAYAWASIANTNGFPAAKELLDRLSVAMEQEEKNQASAIADTLWRNPRVRAKAR